MARRLLFSVVLLFGSAFFYKGYTRVVRIVNGGGVSHRSKYIIDTHGHLGGMVCPFQTKNVMLNSNYGVIMNCITVDISWVPVEYFTVSHVLKIQRKVYYDVYDQKSATSDVYVNFNFHLFHKIGNQYSSTYEQDLVMFKYVTGSSLYNECTRFLFWPLSSKEISSRFFLEGYCYEGITGVATTNRFAT